MAVRLFNGANGCKTTYALLDSGSDRDIVSQKLASDLNLELKRKTVTIQTVETSTTNDRLFTNFRVESMDGNYVANVSDALVGELLTGDNDIPPAKRQKDSLQYINDIDFIDLDESVNMILGISHAEAWIGANIRRGNAQQPIAIETSFGWTLVGGWSKGNKNNIACSAISVDDERLHQDFRRIFHHDFAPVTEEEIGESKDNRDAIRQLAESIRMDKDAGKYKVALPWKGGRQQAVETLNQLDSKRMAMNRLQSMIPRFRRDPARMERVFTEMAKFEEKGYAIEVDEEEQVPATDPTWYLPLHVVEKGAKTRICHDARAAVRGTCLNEMLLGGPNLLNSLPGIIMRFRTKRIAFMMDIASFFHQILVDEKDVNVFRYLWFTDKTLTKTKIMRFKANIFGSISSSIIAAYTLRHHAEVVKDDYSEETYEVIKENIYVDDASAVSDEEDEAVDLKEELKEALERGGFTLAKWKSNCPRNWKIKSTHFLSSS